MLVRPDRRWWACVGLCRRLLTRGAFGKLIWSNILRGLTWSYIPSVAMVIHVAERSRNQIAVEGCRSLIASLDAEYKLASADCRKLVQI